MNGSFGLPGWFPDPFRRARYRFWNGEIWTNQIFDGAYGIDVVSIDNVNEGRMPDGVWSATPGSLAFSLGGLACSFGLSLLLVLLYILLGRPGGSLVLLLMSELGLWSGLVGTCVLARHRYGSGKLRADFRLRFRWIDIAIGFGGAIVGRSVAAFVLIPFLHELKSAGNPDKSLFAVRSLGALGWIVLTVVTCVGAPLFEELFFRGLLQGQLVERLGPWIAIPIASIVFGAVHIANDPGIAGLLLALSVGAGGIVLGTVRHMTGRLGSSMVTHCIFNGFALAVLAATAAH